MLRKVLLILPLLAFLSIKAYPQCNVTLYGNGATDTIEICMGDSVTLIAIGGCPNDVLVDFNNSSPGIGWTTTNQAMYNNPCVPHSLDGTIYLWMGSASTAPRKLTSADLDVSVGGDIEFEMRYAIQADPIPCEGPDLYNEGIAVQYSTNGGATWNDIVYYTPYGDVLSNYTSATSPAIAAGTHTQFTVWSTRTLPIPTSAQTTSTRFRWVQFVANSDDHDHWGLDNVSILLNPPTIEVWWDHSTHQGYSPPSVTPVGDTTFTVTLTNGTDTVQSSLHVIVHPTPDINLGNDLNICVDQTIVLDAGAGFSSYFWSTLATTQTITVEGVVMGLGTHTYWVDVWDNNDCLGNDTIKVTFIDCTGVETLNNGNIQFSPNPANSSITVKLNETGGIKNYKILNIHGQILLEGLIIDEKTIINISSLPKGIYFIRLEKENNNIIWKFVKESN